MQRFLSSRGGHFSAECVGVQVHCASRCGLLEPEAIGDPTDRRMPDPFLSIMTKNVLLLHEPSQEGNDKYEAALRNALYNPVSVPVLETVLCNLAELSGYMQHVYQENSIVGVVITSKRSCEAISAALDQLEATGLSGKSPSGRSPPRK